MEIKMKNLGRWCRTRIVEQLTRTVQDNPSLFITEFAGLKVKDVEDLRRRLRKDSGRLVVVKNSLASQAFNKLSLGYLSDNLTGQTGLVLGGDDPALISKALVDFGKNFPTFQIKGGVFKGESITVKQIKLLSQLPPRNILLAKVCYGLKAPLYRLAANLGLVNKFILTLKQIEKSKKEG